MAEVAVPGRYNDASGFAHFAAPPMVRGAPEIEMVRNTDFSFPATSPRARLSSLHPSSADVSRRPVSVHSESPPATAKPKAHRRARSDLPSFSFNAADATGLKDTLTPPLTPDGDEESACLTPSVRHGHKRQTSELIGGDSRLGMDCAMSSSPTKGMMFVPPVLQPSSREGAAYRHRRFQSSVSTMSVMQPTTSQAGDSPTMTATLLDQPETAMTHRAVAAPYAAFSLTDPFGTPANDTENRPPSSSSRHVKNSISSVLSLGTPSPPSTRYGRRSFSEDEARSRAKLSLELRNRIDEEGEWLSRKSFQSEQRSSLDMASAPNLTTAPILNRDRAEPTRHAKRHSLSQALRLDRRRSEPAISTSGNQASRSSTTSLQDTVKPSNALPTAHEAEGKAATRKIKDWTLFKFSKKAHAGRGETTGEATQAVRPQSSCDPLALVEKAPLEHSTAETDLDAVFGMADTESPVDTPSLPLQSRMESTVSGQNVPQSSAWDLSDSSPILDLDAALGPFKTPPLGTHRPRHPMQMHSSRSTTYPSGPAMHYHGRTQSAPDLMPWSRGSVASCSSLPDVFEGDDEDEYEQPQTLQRPKSAMLSSSVDAGVGIQIVDVANEYLEERSGLDWRLGDGLRISTADWEPERPSTSYGNLTSRLSTPSLERRSMSIMEETIPEESSPIDIDVVEAHEEPRSSSVTKSSDSSETPTLITSQAGNLGLPDGSQSLMTPDTYQTSTFSSPDFARRQGSFDTSRLGTAASSVTDSRTLSSSNGDQHHDNRVSVDDVPSLTSSRSTMMSTMNHNASRVDVGGTERTLPPASRAVDPAVAAERRRKRASIASFSQLVGASFSAKSKTSESARPQTAGDALTPVAPKKKEHRLKKLMFWRSKSKQSLRE
ncbi:hypothetical protein BAUCODRAFT_400458 [Baudoinia panamericana UAMH 10762]|uniref:Cell wall proline rich protein n=1 Tax=Baudoinia panamericana (strain UAMH 10762) TaxID=717646 RepID=M2MRA8_BAUPA|nr:uncharacterized protein BAUCODRAFT_400458 [Baudoinia panamericana UAMH 10762]EMC99371.1 hypothetical protein BAUCODRAFT_400458 [Baudoinia panamericana UAMH 10762]